MNKISITLITLLVIGLFFRLPAAYADTETVTISIQAGSFTVGSGDIGVQFVMTGAGTIEFPECTEGFHFSVMNKQGNDAIIAHAEDPATIYSFNYKDGRESSLATHTLYNVDRNSVSQFTCIGSGEWSVLSNGNWLEP